jgi:hypothetical protein
MTMNIIPKIPEVTHAGLVALGGVLLAAFILSRFPAVRDWVAAQSITVKDGSNKVLYF